MQIARRTSMAESHFHRLFKKITGNTPYQYYLLVRLTHASDLLKGTKESIGNISSATGFF
jgi:transcriptional regulator GlxA family with amidase domain